MAGRDFTVSAILRARDFMSRPVLGATKNVAALNHAAAQVGGFQANGKATAIAAAGVKMLGAAAVGGAAAISPLPAKVEGVTRAATAAVAPLKAAAAGTEAVTNAARQVTGPLRDASGRFLRAGESAGDAATPMSRLAREINSTGRAARRNAKEVDTLAKAVRGLKQAGEGLQDFGGNLAGAGAGITATLAVPVMAFANLEDAQVRAGVAFLTRSGQDTLFGQVEQQAMRLGSLLPGTTSDVLQMAAALKEAGTSTASIVNGGLEATAYARVLLDQSDPVSAGRLMATFRQSLGVADKDLVGVTDLVQRGKFGFGLDPTEFAMGLKYVAPVAKRLNLGGIDNARGLVAMAGSLSQSGIRGEQLGTGLRSSLLKLPEVEGKAKSKKSDAGKILQQAGIRLDFFDAAGQFIGIKGFIGQIEQLSRLNPERQMAAFSDLFGSENAPMMMDLAARGVKGHLEALRVLDQQASLQQRVDRVLGSFRSLWEAATGTAENTFAAIGGTLAPDLKRWSTQLNANAEKVGAWVEAHQPLVRMLAKIAALTGAAAIVTGGASLALGTAARVFAPAVGAVGAIGGVGGAFVRGATGGTVAKVGAKGVAGRLGVRAAAVPGAVGTRYRATNTAVARSRVGRVFTRPLTRGGAGRAGRALIRAPMRAAGRGLGGAVSTGMNLFNAARLMQVGTFAGAGARIVGVLKVVGLAIRGVGLALVANPLGLILAAAALLVFRYWRPIVAFLKGVGRGFMEAFKPAMPAINEMGRAMRPLLDFVVRIAEKVWAWIKPVETAGTAATTMGEKFGAVLGGIVRAVVEFPVKFYTLGANIMVAIGQGMKSMATAPLQHVRELGAKIMAFFPQSPAKKGPLRGLHRIKWAETLALGMNAGPAVAGMRRLAAGVMGAAAIALPAPAFASAGVPSLRSADAAYALPAGAGASSTQIVYAPTYRIEGGGVDADALRRLEQAQARDRAEFARLIREWEREKNLNRTRLGRAGT